MKMQKKIKCVDCGKFTSFPKSHASEIRVKRELKQNEK
jgi:hypothetical protein